MIDSTAFTIVADAVLAPIAVFDLEAKNLYANAPAKRMLRLDGGIWPEPAMRAAFDRVRDDDRSGREVVSDGDAEWLFVRRGTSVVVVGRDPGAAALAQKTIELENAHAEAERANRAKDDFLGMLAHELRTPLHAMLGWCQILRQSVVSEERWRHGLETVERNARAMSKLVDDLVDVARIKSGKLSMQSVPVDVRKVVESAIEVVSASLEAKHVRVVLDVDGAGPLRIEGDPVRLEQVVWNLLSNAVKFADDGGEIRISLRGTPDHVVLEIEDDGRGIDPSFLPHVFERFRQADTSLTRKVGGLGLGLAITKSLVELHGGSVSAHSDGVGRGARFRVELPSGRDVR